MKTMTREMQAAMTPRESLEMLEQGNERFSANARGDRDLLEQAGETETGQFPFAVVLSCIDSRASAELVFDQGIGDIFSCRVAGNVLSDDALGSMEFACKLAGSKLIVILGHSSCGAVKGACDGAELGHLTGLLRKIQPSVDEAREGGGANRDEFVQRVADLNVTRVVAELRHRSSVLDAMIRAGEVGIVGAMYSLKTGKVEFGELISGELA